LERKRPALRPATIVAYQASAGRVVAELAGVRLNRLTPALLAATFDRLRRVGVGSRTLQQAHTYLGSCLRAARAEGYLHPLLHPAGGTGLPGVERPRHRPRERPRWTVAETQRFLAVCERPETLDRRPLAAACALAVLVGLRRGELLGLRWRDVDFAGRQLTVRRQRTPRGEGPVKTAAAVRVVPLSERAVAVLKGIWDRTPPDGRGPDEVVVRTRHTTPPHPDAVRKTLQKLCQEAAVPPLPLHGLRHVFASLAAAGGLDPVALAAVLGHARPSTSLDIYSYAVGVERAADAVERGLTAARP
jgi:integrase